MEQRVPIESPRVRSPAQDVLCRIQFAIPRQNCRANVVIVFMQGVEPRNISLQFCLHRVVLGVHPTGVGDQHSKSRQIGRQVAIPSRHQDLRKARQGYQQFRSRRRAGQGRQTVLGIAIDEHRQHTHEQRHDAQRMSHQENSRRENNRLATTMSRTMYATAIDTDQNTVSAPGAN